MLDASPTALRAFVLVATLRSFSKAARALGSRQSTVSSQIARLEELVGKPLLERSTRRVALAPAGKRLLPLAEEIVELHTVAAARVHDTALSGQVRFACPEALWTSFAIAEAIGRFTRSHPDVKVAIELQDEIDIGMRIGAGALDLGLLTGATASTGARLIRRERLRWFGRAPDVQHGMPLALIDSPFEPVLAAIDNLIADSDPAAPRCHRVLQGAGVSQAAQAVAGGLGVAALAANHAEQLGLPVYQNEWLPALPNIDVWMLAGEQPDEVVVALRTQLLQRLARGPRGTPEPGQTQRATAAKRSK